MYILFGNSTVKTKKTLKDIHMEPLKITKKTHSEILEELDEETTKREDQQAASKSDQDFIAGLDSFEFTWNKLHPLRNVYKKLRREMYAKYDCLNHENIDLKMLVDEVIVLKTQLSGIGRMTLDGKGPKNLPFRVSKHQSKLLELMTVLLKYTRKEPEKSLKKVTVNKGKVLADNLKNSLPEHTRKKLSENFKEILKEKYDAMNDDMAPFDDHSYTEDEDIEDEE
jgi:hypothetical protein